jgi:hypothetical protein
MSNMPPPANRVLSRARVRAEHAEILQYEREVRDALRLMARRTRYEPASADTPLSALLAGEDGMLDEWAVRNETIRTFFAFLLVDGPEPHKVMRRLYTVAAHMMIEPFCLLTVREMGLMLGDSAPAAHWRMQRMCVNQLKRVGAKSYKGPGHKSALARDVASRSQRGNQNRKQGAGRAVAREHFRSEGRERL